MAKRYRLETILASDWHLPDERPRVLIAQIPLAFMPTEGDDRRFRRIRADEPDEILIGLISQLRQFDAHFLVFPEYACPWHLLARLLETVERELPEGAVCVLPFEHLQVSEYFQLLTIAPIPTPLAKSAKHALEKEVPPAHMDRVIVGACLIIGRTATRLWAVPQLKLAPAALEEDDSPGYWRFWGDRTIRSIKGANCHFAVSICFDFIARDEALGLRPRERLAEAELDFLFVPECNPKPLHVSYAVGALDVLERSVHRPRQPILIFANAASGTTLPRPIAHAGFGFSRIQGRLGHVSPAVRNVFLTRPGVVVSGTAMTLADLRDTKHEFVHPTIMTTILRHQESLGTIRVPTLGRTPSLDPETGRTNTQLEVFRRIRTDRDRWRPIRSATHRAESIEIPGIPTELVVQPGLIGLEDEAADLLAALASSTAPVCVTGSGGGGKTALVATVLSKAFPSNRYVRVVWLDMARLPNSSYALAEALLLQLGLADALTGADEEQWTAIRQELLSRPTILVLDSMERSHVGVVPPALSECHVWPSRIVITSRSADGIGDGSCIQLSTLAESDSLELVRRTLGLDYTDELGRQLHACSGGSPLAILWLCGYVKGQTRPPLPPGLLGKEGTPDLADAFSWSLEGAGPTEKLVLALLAYLPEPLFVLDIAAILKREPGEVNHAVENLHRRHLVMSERGCGGASHAHTRHPFVRQFAERVLAPELTIACVNVEQWVVGELDRHGGEWNWRGLTRLREIWPNTRPTIDRLSRATADADLRKFLHLWSRVDYFLFSSGRWHQRRELAELAAHVAADLEEPLLRGYALCALSEVDWCMHQERRLIEAALTEACGLFDAEGDSDASAHALYYKARMLRHLGSRTEAGAAAAAAIQASEVAGPFALGLAYNNLGSLLVGAREYIDAGGAFDSARTHFAACGDHPGSVEMIAVVLRNQGRLALELGRYGEAVEALEEAMESFQRTLRLQIEHAETAAYHALALARMGEHQEAWEEIHQVKVTMDRLGSVDRSRKIDAILSLIHSLGVG